MTHFLLLRHAWYDGIGRLLGGRAPGHHLNPRGQAQARGLVARLAGEPLAAIYCSPLERACETAAPLAEARGLPVQISTGLLEVDFGAWTGRTLAELDPLPAWQRWNSHRSETRIEGGESMAEVQDRIVGELGRLRERHDGETVALFSHGDVIKAALLHALGLPFEAIFRFEIDPASISGIALGPDGPRVTLLNAGASVDGIERARDLDLPLDRGIESGAPR